VDIGRLLDGINDPALRSQFHTFIESGEATDAFLDLLDATPAYQQVADVAFQAQAARLERFAAHLRYAETAAAPEGEPSQLSSRLAWTVKQAAKLPADALDLLTEQTVRAVPPEQRPRVNSLVSKLSEAFGR